MKQNNFNLLRLLFSFLVIIAHAPELMDGNRSRELLTLWFGTISFGELAVDGFFIISGFLILGSWHRQEDPIRFLMARVLRIYPGFLVAAIFCLFLVIPAYTEGGLLTGFPGVINLESIFRLAQLRLPEQGPVFVGSHYPVVNGALWSISFEFKAYLVVLGMGVCGLLKSRKVWMGVTSLLIILYLVHKSHVYDFGWRFLTIRTLMCFFVGGAFFTVKDKIKYTGPWALVSLICLALGLSFTWFAEIAVALFLGYLIFFIAFRLRCLNFFNKMPDISYGVYLYAWPINKILLWHFPEVSLVESVLIVSVISALFGALSWYLVEKPALRLKPAGFNYLKVSRENA